MPLLREDQATISVPKLPVALPFVRSWAKLEGGDLESEDTKVRPGGMLSQINLGGPTTRTDATVSRPYSAELHPFLVPLEQVAGNGSMNITWTVLNAQRVSLGNTVTLTGILKTVNRPAWDANATAPAMLALVMGCDVDAQQTQ